ncbi:MAG: Gx transporter family protein [Lachnospiraceae bacterium]|nr:Gx transporter family protein [Lachnospiraceae bacterium]
MKGKQVALYGLLISLAFVFSYVEMLIPLPLPTGVKLGAANIVVMIALYLLGVKEALAISMVRILLSGFAFGMGTVPYSLVGGGLSLLVMALLKKSGKFGMPAVSVSGGVAHNLGQTLVAMLLLGSKTTYYFPVLFFSGIISGIIIGIISALVLKKLQGLKL